MATGEGRGRQRGVVLLAVLLFVLASTLAAATLVEMHRTQSRRDREAQLLFVGDQYRRAIASYYSSFAPGAPRGLPQSLEDLLRDPRFPQPVRHLRRLYPDPMTGAADWKLVRAGGGIVGIASRSEDVPLKKSGFAREYGFFEGAAAYADWVFAIQP